MTSQRYKPVREDEPLPELKPLSKTDRMKLADITKQQAIIQDKIGVIRARHTKAIYTNPSYETISYNSRLRVQEADLILELAEDIEYQALINKGRELGAEQIAITGDDLFGI